MPHVPATTDNTGLPRIVPGKPHAADWSMPGSGREHESQPRPSARAGPGPGPCSSGRVQPAQPRTRPGVHPRGGLAASRALERAGKPDKALCAYRDRLTLASDPATAPSPVIAGMARVSPARDRGLLCTSRRDGGGKRLKDSSRPSPGNRPRTLPNARRRCTPRSSLSNVRLCSVVGGDVESSPATMGDA
jgi:hypothetical protein